MGLTAVYGLFNLDLAAELDLAISGLVWTLTVVFTYHCFALYGNLVAAVILDLHTIFSAGPCHH